jgi:D-alanyl-D-alanine carboxypeptidase/D-alanyl-D-alanine-endopeptidase (penicillin-binding protein 4)
MKRFAAYFLTVITLISCSVQKKIAKEANNAILGNTEFAGAHVGISIYDPATQQYLYDHQGDKFFVPASNTKLLTCYAAMKYLGDSLVAFHYRIDNDAITIQPAADPTFLHPDFKQQRGLDFLRGFKKINVQDNNLTHFQPFGRGWAWDDFDSDYIQERSAMPVYGNSAWFSFQKDSLSVMPRYFYPLSNLRSLNAPGTSERQMTEFGRAQTVNRYTGVQRRGAQLTARGQQVPFIIRQQPDQEPIYTSLLRDTLHVAVATAVTADARAKLVNTLHSQPTDSMLSIMMHRSDNFFAEQSLLMVGFEKFGEMSDRQTIDTLLKTDYSGMPQKPKWVDGSGLSRYNLVSPQDFVFVLNKMKSEFKWERIQAILPTGGTGTLSSYYKNYAGRIYAKTGSLSNHLALSGYIITKKGKQLIFSVLVNAEMAPPANIRKGVEKFLTGIIDRY